MIALLLLVYLILLLPLQILTGDYRDTAENQRFKLQRLKQAVSEKDLILQRLDKIKALSQGNEAFLPTGVPSIASAELQSRIKQIVGQAGGELSSTQVIPEQNEENAIRIGVKARLNASTPTLRQILHDFESGKPYLFIDNLNIRPIRQPRNPKDKNAGEDDKLSVDFDVIGYMQAP